MKKVLYIMVTVLELACFAGAYTVSYFTRKRMGMARYVIYKNQNWGAEYPLAPITFVVIILAAVLAFTALALYIRKRKGSGKLMPVMVIMTFILNIWYIGFTLSNSADTLRPYYFMSGLFALTAVLQSAKTCAAALVTKN